MEPQILRIEYKPKIIPYMSPPNEVLKHFIIYREMMRLRWKFESQFLFNDTTTNKEKK